MEIQGAIRIDMTGDEIAAALTKSAGLPTPTELEQTIDNIHDELDAKADAGAVSVAVEQLHADVATAQGTADDAQAAATSAQGTADDAQAAATAAKSEADMLRERLIGNGTTISRYFGQAERQNFDCDVNAGTYKFDGGDYMAVTDYVDVTFLAADNATLAHFTSNQFVGNAQERWIDLPSDAVRCSILVFGTAEHPFIAPGTITLKVIDMASLEGKLYDTASTMKTTATVAADLDK